MAVSELKSDAVVRVSEGSGIHVRSTVDRMYGDRIRADVDEAVRLFGAEGFQVEVDDAGALPFVLRARLYAALSRATGRSVPPSPIPSRPPVTRHRRRRTRLYIPADQPRFFMNAAMAGADMVVLDLEDAVAAENKLDARKMVAHCASRIDWMGAELAVRINVGPDFEADLREVCHRGVDTFLLPKVERASDVHAVCAVLDEESSECQLMPLIETALGVEHAFEIASASPRIVAVSLGLEDLITDLGVQRTESQEETAWARARLVNAARAAGVTPLASVYPRFDDPSAVEAYARAARAQGYEGIGSIHPSQVSPAHRGFEPTPEELAWARGVLGTREGGATALDGAMIDAPIVRRARRILDFAGDGR
jgi:citrate lyase subunit beta/citryl-CoA lyase